MNRYLVMGSSGSGKSTFAKRLSAVTSIPIVSLDALYWKPGWLPSDDDSFRRIADEAARAPRWIVDGNFIAHGAGDLRRRNADVVIWFDLPRRTCMWGILKRIAGSYGRVRPEMAPGCPERIDLDFFRYVWTYRRQQRPKLLKYFEGLRDDQELTCFTHRNQADGYLLRFASSFAPSNVH